MKAIVGQRSSTAIFSIAIGRKANRYRSKVQLLSLLSSGRFALSQRMARRREEKPRMFRRLLYTLVLSAFLVSTAMTGCAPVTVQQTTLKNT